MLKRSALLVGAICLLACGAWRTSSLAHAATKINIGVVTFSSSDVDTQNMIKSVTAYAQGKGYTVQSVDANGSLTQANTAITDLVTKKVNVIFVTVFPSKSLAAGLARAQAAHIPVVSAGGGLAPGVAMSTDDGDAPPMLNLMKRQLKGPTKVLDLTYHPGLPCFERAVAFDAVAKNHPNWTVTRHEITIPGAAASAKAATLAWLARNPAGKGNFAIYNCYDDDSLGAIAALKQTHRTGVKVYSYNATPPALAQIKSGWMTATLWLNLPAAGRDLVDAMPQIIAQGANWKPKTILAKYIIVTKGNVNAFMRAHPGA